MHAKFPLNVVITAGRLSHYPPLTTLAVPDFGQRRSTTLGLDS